MMGICKGNHIQQDVALQYNEKNGLGDLGTQNYFRY
jgi:hypothetical protein